MNSTHPFLLLPHTLVWFQTQKWLMLLIWSTVMKVIALFEFIWLMCTRFNSKNCNINISWSYFIPLCFPVMNSYCDIFRHCVNLLLPRTVKVILNTCLWSTAPDDCQPHPTLSIWHFDSHTFQHTHTHRVRDYWLLALTNRIPAFQTLTCLCVTQLRMIGLVRAHQRAENDSRVCNLTHTHTHWMAVGVEHRWKDFVS